MDDNKVFDLRWKVVGLNLLPERSLDIFIGESRSFILGKNEVGEEGSEEGFGN